MFEFIKNKILSYIYPNRCPFCEKVISEHKIICSQCSKEIEIKTSIRKIAHFNGEQFVQCVSPYKYAGKVKEALWKFKFRGNKNCTRVFSKSIAEEISKNFKNIKFDVVTCVPLSKQRYRERGYNQSQWLAREISAIMNLPCESLISKTVDNLPQHELPFKCRIKNVMGVYKALDSAQIAGKNILLCDDILTTGNTLKECAGILIKSGAKNVVCCSVAYV